MFFSRRRDLARKHQYSRTRRRRLSIASLLLPLWCLTGTGLSRAAPMPFAPNNVVHALYLQTQGVLAETATTEPCSDDGLADAVRRSDAAHENHDLLSLYHDQGGFASGFAQCALDAKAARDFAAFAAATVQCRADELNAWHALSIFSPLDRAHAQQIYVIAKWLSNAAAAAPIDKQIAKNGIIMLRRLRAL